MISLAVRRPRKEMKVIFRIGRYLKGGIIKEINDKEKECLLAYVNDVGDVSRIWVKRWRLKRLRKGKLIQAFKV